MTTSAPARLAVEYVTTPRPVQLLALFLESRKETCNARTQQTYRYTLGPFIAWLGDQPLIPDVIRAYLAHEKERGTSETHQHNSYRLIKTMCRWLYDEELIERPLHRQETGQVPAARAHAPHRVQRG